MENPNPCHKCKDRSAECHAVCEKYLAFSKEASELREKRHAYIVSTASPDDHFLQAFRYQKGRGWSVRTPRNRNRNRT